MAILPGMRELEVFELFSDTFEPLVIGAISGIVLITLIIDMLEQRGRKKIDAKQKVAMKSAYLLCALVEHMSIQTISKEGYCPLTLESIRTQARIVQESIMDAQITEIKSFWGKA